ncbi:TPA: hypothetical protein HA344_05295 [Candidatus Bathyarchaeota archaeon]|nr:hypothetical protein [Candidatus Bathyarchaeota archaeon]
MQKTGRNLDDPNLPGAVDVMDLLTVKEQGTEILIEDLLDRVGELGAQRLVVDSFTALATAFQKTIDARITLHILGKLTKRSGCTTLLIIEIPSGSSNIGVGVEEFLADCIILLRRAGVGGVTTRSLEVVKMRGTEIQAPQQLFPLHGSFKALEPFREKPRGRGSHSRRRLTTRRDTARAPPGSTPPPVGCGGATPYSYASEKASHPSPRRSSLAH